MEIETNIDLGFPSRLFSLGCEPRPKKSINYHSKTEFLEDVENAVGKEVWKNIRDSPLGVIVRFVDNKFTWSSKVVEYLLAKQLVCKRKYEIWCLFGNKPARFSLSEFEDVTTLNCAPFPNGCDQVVEATKVHKELWKKLKIKGKENPCKKDLRNVCEDAATWSPEDKTRFAYLSIVSVILGYDDKKRLPSTIARMVFDLPKFEKYPWGRLVFKQLIESVKRIDYKAQSYTIHGFIQALQIWAYFVVPSLGAKIGRPSNVDGPPLLQFKGTKGKSNIDIHTIVVKDESNIKSLAINHSTSAVWEDVIVDKEIDALIQAIFKEGGLEAVIWVKDGLNNIQLEENIREELGGETRKAGEDKGEKDDDTKISLKRKREVNTMDMKKTSDSKDSISSIETIEALQLRIEQQTKQFKVLEAQLEAMKNQIQSIELMRLRVDLLEKEISLLNEKLKTNEVLKGYQLKDSSDEETPIGDLLANLNARRPKMVDSDEESTADIRYPPTKLCNELPQQSSSVKIFQPTPSNVETFQQKKISKTVKIMEMDQASKIVREKSKRETKPGPSLLTPYRGTKPVVGITTKVNQSMAIVGRGYDPFASVDVKKVKVLDDWLQLDEEYPIGSQQNGVEFFKILRTPQQWLNEEHINSGMNLLRLRFMKNPKAFRSERIAFTDVYFTTIWSTSYQEFLGSKSLPIFPNGAFEYVSGELPAFAKTRKKWKTEVDDIYGVLHVNKNHWVGLFISIPNRSIDVFDCGWKCSKNEDIVTAVRPIAHMLPHLLRAGAPPLERGKMSVEQYKIRRPRTRIPQMQKVGDCGIYAIKFVECHALGAEFTTPLSDADIKMVREKLAAEIFDETEQHGRTVSNPFPFGTNDHELLYPS